MIFFQYFLYVSNIFSLTLLRHIFIILRASAMSNKGKMANLRVALLLLQLLPCQLFSSSFVLLSQIYRGPWVLLQFWYFDITSGFLAKVGPNCPGPNLPITKLWQSYIWLYFSWWLQQLLWWCFITRALEYFSWYIWCLSNLFCISFYVLHSWIWKSGLANLAESYNNVFAAVNLLRGTAVNAKILHVVINAGLVGHKASHQLKYDPGGVHENFLAGQIKIPGGKIWQNISYVQLCSGTKFLTQSAQHCYKILCS